MVITAISFWLPLLWALFVGISWHFTWKKPINHPIVCLLLAAVCFFFFAWTIIAYIVMWIFKSGILKSLMQNKEDEPTK
jgi:hypothetical protein